MDKYLLKYGYGWYEQKWKTGTMDKILKSKDNDLRIMINEPTIRSDSSKSLTARDFKHIRGFMIDVDPIKSYDVQLKKEGADWTLWRSKLKKQIRKINNIFLKLFKKSPTYITESGKGIHVVFFFHKPILRGKFSTEMEKKVGFIFKLIEMQLLKEFEIDKALFDIKKAGELFDRMILKKARPPKNGMTVIKSKYDHKTKKSTLVYESVIENAIYSKEKWNIEEMYLDQFKGMMSGLFAYQKMSYTEERREAISILADHFSNESGTIETDKKVYKIKCVIPSHTDNTPSAVFFKDSGIYYCSGCEKALQLEDTYQLVTGDRLEVADRVTMFTSLPERLIRYSVVGEDGLVDKDLVFTFLLGNEKEITFRLSDWVTDRLQKWSAYNLIKGFTPKKVQPVLEGITEMCESNNVPRVEVVKAGFYKDKIVFNNKVSYRKTEAGYLKTVNYDAIKQISVNWGDSISSNVIYDSMKKINSTKYNATVFAIVLKSMISPVFVDQLSFHPFTYVYGNRDKGKTAIVSLAQSIISQEYQKHLYGSANTEHVFISSLINYNHLPVLIDEVKSLADKDGLIQTLKSMATNGGIIRKGKVGKELFDTYMANADLFIASEFRITLDPSFYQRTIEINMNDYEIDTRNAIKFNKLLRQNKTSVLWDLMEFLGEYNIDFFELEEIVEKQFKDFSLLEAKKRMASLLWIGSLKTSYMFMAKHGLCQIGEENTHINEYLKNEVSKNGSKARDLDISESIILFLQGKMKLNLSTICSRLSFIVKKDSLSVRTSSKALLLLGWKNPHELGELKVNDKSSRSILENKVFSSNIEFKVSNTEIERIDSLLTLLDMAIEMSKINDNNYNSLYSRYNRLVDFKKEN